MKAPGSLRYGPFSNNFEEDFLSALEEASRENLLSPPVVLVGSNYLGLHLRHLLTSKSSGTFGIRFLTFVDLADELLAPSIGDRQPFPSGVEELFIEDLAKTLPKASRFYEVATRSGFHRALKSTFHDLLDGGISELPEKHGKLGDISDLFRRHRSSYLPKFLATADRLLEAAEGSEVFEQRFQTNRLFIYGFYDLTEAQSRLIRSLSARVQLNVWLPTFLLPSKAIEKTQTLFDDLTDHSESLSESEPCLTHGFSAPSFIVESEDVIRRILAIAERGIPLHHIAILVRDTETYLRPILSAAQRAGLPIYLEGGTALSETAWGRGVLALLDLLNDDVDRATLVELLRALPFDADRWKDLGTADDWDAWTREALVTQAGPTVSPRLLALAQRLAEYDPTRDHLLRNWVPFLSNLLSSLQALKTSGIQFGGFASALWRIVQTYFAPSPEAETFLGVLGRLSALDSIGVPSSFERCLEMTRQAIESAKTSGGVFERSGVYVGSIESVRMIPFKQVFMVGLSEGAFPSPPRPDPLLLDSERRILNSEFGAGLSLKEQRTSEERVLFDMVRAMATDGLTLSYSRMDVERGRESLPSPWWTEASTTKEDLPLHPWTATPKMLLDESDWLSSRVAGEILRTPTSALSLIEPLTPLAAGVSAWIEQRLGNTSWGPYDGLVSLSEREQGRLRVLSASDLSEYATCPHRFFLSRILKLSKLEQPELLDTIRPSDRGKLIHQVLFRFFTWAREEKLLPLKPADHAKLEAHLQTIAKDLLGDVHERLPVGHRLLWNSQRQLLASDLTQLLAREIDQGGEFVPLDFEVRFGMTSRPGVEEGNLSTDAPVTLNTSFGPIGLKGRLDRLDRTTDGKRLRIIDYKTGQVDRFKENNFAGGTAMQLPVYLEAAKLLQKDIALENMEAILLTTGYEYGFQERVFDGAIFSARHAEFLTLIGTAAKAMAAGLFIPNPGSDRANCKFCDFVPICGRQVDRLFERKAADPVLEPLRALEEIE